MTLEAINQRLEKLIVELPKAGKELGDLQLKLETKKAKLYLSSDCSVAKNQEMRDAFVSENTTKLRENVAYALGEYRKLSNEKELLLVIASNLRTIGGVK